MAKPRDYKKEGKWHATLVQKRRRACRNAARRKAEREGKVAKGDGREVDHINPLSNGGACGPNNERVVSKKLNRKKGANKRNA